ncbi:unnamed protein product [Rotaria sordida]|uniref:Uncharacterized protein n=1 Tax=Rotaria sordida TaxID=392033 RepID=A0A818N5U1_9BILA|nr:unnamed protein product [Rotaria sordida]CAF3600825.1 unnamed protein product [Rotaria sordida]
MDALRISTAVIETPVYVMPPIYFTFICDIPTGIVIACGCRMVYNIGQSRKLVAQQIITQNQTLATIAVPISKTTSTINNERRQNITTDLTQLPFNIYAVYYGYETTKNNLSYSLTRSLLLMWSSVYFDISLYLFCCASQQFQKQFLTKIKTNHILRRSSQRRIPLTRHN